MASYQFMKFALFIFSMHLAFEIFLQSVASAVTPDLTIYQKNLSCFNCYEAAYWNRTFCQKPVVETCRDTYPNAPSMCLQVFQWFDPQFGSKNTVLEQCQPRYAIQPEIYNRCQIHYRREIDGTQTLVGMCACFDNLCNNKQLEFRNRTAVYSSNSYANTTAVATTSPYNSTVHSMTFETTRNGQEEFGDRGYGSSDLLVPSAMLATSDAVTMFSPGCDCLLGSLAFLFVKAVSVLSTEIFESTH